MYGTSITRLSGLASGMDTDSLVKKLMQAESARLNKMMQSKQKYEWQSDGYRQWNSDLFSFYGTTLFNMKLSGQYGTFNVSTSDNSFAVSGTATADAVAGTYTMEVDQLAQSATMVSNVDLDPTKTLSAQGMNSTGPFTIVTTDQSGKSVTATISVDPTKDKIGDVVSRINSFKDTSGNSLDIKAVYDPTLKQFIIKTKDTGANTKIQITDDSGGFFGTTLKFSDTTATYGIDRTSPNAPYSTTNNPGDKYAAADASIKFNGSTSPISSSSNTLSIMGVSYTLKNTTALNSPISITISRDLDTEVKNIKDFIGKYNDMLDKLNKAIDEPVYRDYQPLTDDQKASMTDKQIEQWETKAKSGLFHNDSILSGLVNNLRNHMTSTVDNGSSKYNSLSSIGIKSSSWEDKGKLYVDETKLRAALQDDPEAVQNLFKQDPSNATEGKRGIIPKIYDDVKNVVASLTNKAGKTGSSLYDQSIVGKLLSNLNTQIADEQQRLTGKETQYYKQFTAMETAMSQFNNQSSWLSQQLSMNG
ncbi:flagellar filament capping protein FliD [Neobacillus cucumis]|nr:flagellar filament capping protein FliD [Neobacillus cucumis]